MPSTTFSTTGWNTWKVPAKVKLVTITMDGAGSGSIPGGRVSGKLSVSDKWTLYAYVGVAGHLHSGAQAGGGSGGGGGGGGGGHGSGGVGGDGGGGATYIRVNSKTGSLKAVAGGAGGNSGDGGRGGAGGGQVGESGHRGTSGSNPTEVATGGTQTQGGNGGTSASGSAFNGKNAIDTIAATAGAGGNAPGTTRAHGGGGGGGGYHPGGGGQAASIGYAPGGGGGGGSSFVGGLTAPVNTQGGGGTGNGSITISWTTPPPANQPPTPPTELKINKVDYQADMLTKAKSSVQVTAKIDDPNKDQVKLVARWSASSTLHSYRQVASKLILHGKTTTLTLDHLAMNTRYYVRLYTVDQHGAWSNYSLLTFWTNKAPYADGLTVNTQGDNMVLPVNSSATFAWMHNDQDVADFQSAFSLRYRTAATSTSAAGAWTTITHNVHDNLPPSTGGPPTASKNQWVFNPQTFKGNRNYEWQVKTCDGVGLWGPWSLLSSFYAQSTHTPPTLISPANHKAADVAKPTTFTWKFVDPDPSNSQQKADLRYRVVGNTQDIALGTKAPINWSQMVWSAAAVGAGGYTISQDFDVDDVSGRIYVTQAETGALAGTEDMRITEYLGPNLPPNSTMMLPDSGHGLPIRVDNVNGRSFVTVCWGQPNVTPPGQWVRLPWTPGKVWTKAEALTYPTPGPPEFVTVDPAWAPWFQGAVSFESYEYRLHGAPMVPSGPEYSGTSNNIDTRLDVYLNKKIIRSLNLHSLGRTSSGVPIDGRLEPQGLSIFMLNGTPMLGIGICTGTRGAHNRRHWIYAVMVREVANGNLTSDAQWVTLPSVATTGQTCTVASDTFVPEYTYEWEVRTYDTKSGLPSDWSDPFSFYAIGSPGALADPLPVADNAGVQGELGCGTYRVFVYQQGGRIRLGELEPVNSLNFERLRDDISTCQVTSSGFSYDCGAFYATIRSWMHELVVFRDGVRVWEGPITRITYTTTSVEFEARDVMAYVYRRIMRQGYNDAYRLIKKGTNGQPNEYLGLLSVVERAQMLLIDALAPYDPNILPYVTALIYPDDAKESRVVADWSRSYWEEVDDLAATAGLDYTTVGRRVILWDTHRSIGRLPELRDGDFSESPVVTEYGMQLATLVAVTNGSGVAGYAQPVGSNYPYGPIELLSSSYSDTAASSGTVQTPEALAQATAAMVAQAKRNISGRWPTPLLVRIPDNSTLSPKANIGFQQLIPGVWMPLRSSNTVRDVLQWQKLDSVSVEVDENGEKVSIVLSPAPNGGNDPDADLGGDDS